MTKRENIIGNIIFKLHIFGNYHLEDVDIYDDDEQRGESHKVDMIYLSDDNIPCVELENGDVIELEELSYTELLSIQEELS